jgi:hypothetical protein
VRALYHSTRKLHRVTPEPYPGDMVDAIDWLNDNQGAVMAALTAVYVVATIVIVRSSHSSLEEQRKLRAEQFRPFVIADLENDGERHVIFFRVENLGTMTARDVQFTVTPPFTNPKNPGLGLDIPLVDMGLAALPPSRSLRSMIAVYGDLGEADVRHTVGVSYKSGDGREFSDEFVLDFAAHMGLKLSPSKGTHSIAETLDKLERDVAGIATQLRSLLIREETD